MRVKRFLRIAGFLVLSVCAGALVLASCSNTVSSGGGGSGGGLSFDMTSLKGLAVAEASGRSAERAATSAESLLKITEDGELKSFMNIPEGVYDFSINYIAQPPAGGSNEIYIVFNNALRWWEDDGGEKCIGQLICVYEDGTWCDILQPLIQESRDSWSVYLQDTEFDSQGNLYYLAGSQGGYYGSGGSVIYRFDPDTKKSTEIVAEVSGTSYESFMVSASADWVFAKGSRYSSDGTNSTFLRAIPVSDTGNPANLFYSSEWVDMRVWTYDESTRDVYYVLNNDIYRIPYKGGTYSGDNKVLVGEYIYGDYDSETGSYVGGNWNNISDIAVSDRSLYAVDNTNGIWEIWRITDSSGASVCEKVEVGYDEAIKVVSTSTADNDFYIKASLLDSGGSETGYHTMLRFDPASETLENMLEYVPNHSTYEIVSHEIDNGSLWCVLVRGTSIKIWKIDLASRNCSEFATSEASLKQIMIVR